LRRGGPCGKEAREGEAKIFTLIGLAGLAIETSDYRAKGKRETVAELSAKRNSRGACRLKRGRKKPDSIRENILRRGEKPSA